MPRELDYLADERPITWRDRPFREIVSSSSHHFSLPGLTPTASKRIGDLAQTEAERGFSVVHPPWLGGQAIPRLIVTAKYDGLDAFGASRLMADLDIAARRAGSLYRRIVRDGGADGWPSPMRRSQGGLHLLDARLGSFDVLMTFWGSLVMLATSSPVAVAGLMALALDVGRGSFRLANRWVGAALLASQDDRPSLDAPAHATPWGIQHTKALAPTMREAISNDQGFEFFLDENEHTIKLTVPPKEHPAS